MTYTLLAAFLAALFTFFIMRARCSARTAELKRLGDVKSRVMAVVAHDLRQPLTAIDGYAALLEEDCQTPACQKMAHNIIKSAANINLLLYDLVDGAAASSGKLSIKIKTFSYNKLIDDIRQQYQVTADAKGINFTVAAPKDDIIITADRLRTHQILSNLLNNAFKFAPQGGSIEIKYFIEGAFVRTQVHDSGKGLESAEIALIMERLARPDFALQDILRRGHGLGLSIAGEIVQAHGGVAQVESPGPGKGSTFIFTLPLTTHLK